MEQGLSIAAPQPPERGEFLEPILFLAEQMAAADPLEPRPARPMVDRLAGLCGRSDFRRQPGYPLLDEGAACARLSTERARQGALVVLALVLKTDTCGGPAAHACFARISGRLDEAPLAVPTQVQQHLELALTYLRD
jgi:hypothetical protein